MTFSLKGLKTITNNQYEPACGILSLLDIYVQFIDMIDRFQRPEVMQTKLIGIPTLVQNEVHNAYPCPTEGQISKRSFVKFIHS